MKKNTQNTKDLESKTLQTDNNVGSSQDTLTSPTSNNSSVSSRELIGDYISKAFERQCQVYSEQMRLGDTSNADKSRHLLRTWRDNLVVKTSKLEDRDDARADRYQNQLIKADGHLRAAGLGAVVDDSDFPDALDSSLDIGSNGGDDLGGDC
jgi:hypothetical protein